MKNAKGRLSPLLSHSFPDLLNWRALIKTSLALLPHGDPPGRGLPSCQPAGCPRIADTQPPLQDRGGSSQTPATITPHPEEFVFFFIKVFWRASANKGFHIFGHAVERQCSVTQTISSSVTRAARRFGNPPVNRASPAKDVLHQRRRDRLESTWERQKAIRENVQL